jgi:signal peptidase I
VSGTLLKDSDSPMVSSGSTAGETTAGEATSGNWLRTVGSWLLTAVMVVALMLAMAVVIVPRAIGAVPLTVLTGSMRPVIQPGDLIVSRATNPNNLRIGQIVTFQPVSGDPTLITHRIVNTTRNLDGELISLVTRGDANGSDDAPLVPEQVMGRMLYRIPRIGHLTNNTGGALQIGMLVGAGLIAYALFTLVKPDKPKAAAMPDAEHTPDGELRAEDSSAPSKELEYVL